MMKLIFLPLILGGLLGWLNNTQVFLFRNIWVSDYLFMVSLGSLLFVMGLMFAMDSEAIARFRKGGIKVFLIPVMIMLGSLLGGLIGAFILQIDIATGVAISSGFGWYTLAGPLIGQLRGAEWGAWGLVTNFLRELITIAGILVLVKVDKLAPVAAGGATTMDTTLPIIVKYCGNDVLITAFSSGFVLSIIAPFLITLILSSA